MARVIIIGAGVMGLAAAYRASKRGHSVQVIEAAPEPGGMAGHFDFDGVSIERFYHFVCRTDFDTFALMKELGLEGELVWRPTTMGLYTGGRLYSWGDPVSLLRFPLAGAIDKIRYGFFAFVCVHRNRWTQIEHEAADQWLLRWCGTANYARFWKPLLEYKFHEYAKDISAAWIWARIRRVGRSRKSMMQEQLGYIRGGSITLVNALIAGIQANGGKVHLGCPCRQVTVADGRVRGVETSCGFLPADAVVCTTPTPLVAALAPDLPPEWKQRYQEIHNIGVICVIFKLKRSVTPHFWVNISDPEIEIPGVIEFSNLRHVGEHSIVYVPYYMPVTNRRFSWPDAELISDAFGCLQRLNPKLTLADIVATRVARLRHGQPVCERGFAAKIPPVQTPIDGLQIADTCFYYPEDRGISESVRLGEAMAESITSGAPVQLLPKWLAVPDRPVESRRDKAA